MRNETTKVESKTAPISATYTTDCFAKRKDEDGKIKTVRWQEDRQVVASVQIDREAGAVFHRGARIA